MTKRNPGLISFLQKLLKHSEEGSPTEQRSTEIETPNLEWTGVGSSQPYKDTSGLGNLGKNLIQNPDFRISITLSSIPHSLSCSKSEELVKILDIRGQNDFIKNEFVFVAFLTNENKEILEFGIVQEKVGEYYIVELLNKERNFATVLGASIRIAGIA